MPDLQDLLLCTAPSMVAGAVVGYVLARCRAYRRCHPHHRRHR